MIYIYKKSIIYLIYAIYYTLYNICKIHIIYIIYNMYIIYYLYNFPEAPKLVNLLSPKFTFFFGFTNPNLLTRFTNISKYLLITFFG